MLIQAVGALALVSLATVGCTSVNVSDYPSWCSYVHSPKEGEADVFSMDQEAVKAGVVAAWNKIIFENSTEVLGMDHADVERDSLMQELRRIHAVGAWSVGDTITFGLTVFPATQLNAGGSSAEVFGRQYQAGMEKAATLHGKAEMERGEYCLYEGLNVFFASIVVRTSNSTATIPSEVFERLKKYR